MKPDCNNMPDEVSWVKALQLYSPAIGINIYNKALEIKDKHPEYFPWETKYKSIPDEVHQAYKDEVFGKQKSLVQIYKEFKENGGKIKPSKGLIETIREEGTVVTKMLTPEKVLEALNKMGRYYQEQEEKERKENARRRKIWKKHYGKYKLKFPEERMIY